MRRSLNSLFDVYKEKLSSLAGAMQNANNKIAQVKSDKAKDEAVEYTQSQIEVLSESISLKVEKSEVDKAVDDATKALTTKINDAKSEIKLTTDSITNRVSSTENTITTHTTQLKDVDSRINTVNTEISNTKSKVSAIETNLTGITSRVSSVESKQTTINGKLSSLETWKSSAEQKITDSAIISTVGKEFYKKSETDKQFSNQQSQISQLSDNIDMKVSKDNVVSSINMSPETIKLKASKIDMAGKLDLNGTFTCYSNPTSKTGNYLFQSGAMHRGYIEGWHNPVFSSGIWKPDGKNDVGYVSVGWSNSDVADENGCIWISPIVKGGGSLHFGVRQGSGMVVSGIDYWTDGTISYRSFNSSKSNYGVYAHKFDGNIKAPCLYADNFISSNGTIRCDATLYTDNFSLFLAAGGYDNKWFLELDQNGYFTSGTQGGIQLGTSNKPFYTLYSTFSPTITSDRRKKEEIQYINDGTKLVTDEESLSLDDMYNYIKDLKIATYKLKESREVDKNKIELGFIAQDVADTKVGKYVVDSRDEDNLVYSLGNRITVIEGALQKVIETLEELKSKF